MMTETAHVSLFMRSLLIIAVRHDIKASQMFPDSNITTCCHNYLDFRSLSIQITIKERQSLCNKDNSTFVNF